MEHPQSTSSVTALERQQLSITDTPSATFWHRVRFALVAAEFRRVGAAALIDLGAGSGMLGTWCASHLPGASYRWAEHSEVLAERLRAGYGADTEVVLGDRLPPGAIVAMLDVLEHIEDDDAADRKSTRLNSSH